MNQHKIRIINEVQEGNLNLIPQGQNHNVNQIDPRRSDEFFQRLDKVNQLLDSNYVVKAQIANGAVISQHWEIAFKGEELYDGKNISGVLKFKSNHPITPPTFSFDLLSNGYTIQHENIYQGGLLCIPLLSEQVWQQNTPDSEIIKAIQFIFHNPEPADPANVPFSLMTKGDREKIIRDQAQYLPDWVDNDL